METKARSDYDVTEGNEASWYDVIDQLIVMAGNWV